MRPRRGEPLAGDSIDQSDNGMLLAQSGVSFREKIRGKVFDRGMPKDFTCIVEAGSRLYWEHPL